MSGVEEYYKGYTRNLKGYSDYSFWCAICDFKSPLPQGRDWKICPNCQRKVIDTNTKIEI